MWVPGWHQQSLIYLSPLVWFIAQDDAPLLLLIRFPTSLKYMELSFEMAWARFQKLCLPVLVALAKHVADSQSDTIHVPNSKRITASSWITKLEVIKTNCKLAYRYWQSTCLCTLCSWWYVCHHFPLPLLTGHSWQPPKQPMVPHWVSLLLINSRQWADSIVNSRLSIGYE